jgi:adenylate cyclase
MKNLSCPPQKFLTVKKQFNQLLKQKSGQIEKFPGSYLWLDLRNYSEFTRQHSAGKIVKLLNRYYFLVEKNAINFQGKIIDFLGDGIGVLFTKNKHISRTWQAAMCIAQSLTSLKLALRVGLGINTGPIIKAKSSMLKATKEFYSGATIVKSFRLGVLASRAQKKVLVTKKFYQKLEAQEQKKFKFFKLIRLKGFKKKTAVYCI